MARDAGYYWIKYQNQSMPGYWDAGAWNGADYNGSWNMIANDGTLIENIPDSWVTVLNSQQLEPGDNPFPCPQPLSYAWILPKGGTWQIGWLRSDGQWLGQNNDDHLYPADQISQLGSNAVLPPS